MHGPVSHERFVRAWYQPEGGKFGPRDSRPVSHGRFVRVWFKPEGRHNLAQRVGSVWVGRD